MAPSKPGGWVGTSGTALFSAIEPLGFQFGARLMGRDVSFYHSRTRLVVDMDDRSSMERYRLLISAKFGVLRVPKQLNSEQISDVVEAIKLIMASREEKAA